MTAAEMKRLLLLKFEGLFEFSAPPYSDQQLSDVLNNAQRRIVKDVDSPNPQRNYGGFDYTERVKKYLAPLLSSDDVVSGTMTVGVLGTGIFLDGAPVTLPTNCWYIKQERTVLVTVPQGTIEIKTEAKTFDFYSANKDNPYKKPDSSLVWRLDVGAGDVELITDGTEVYNYKIVYMTEVPDIDITTPTDCILHEDLHDDIVDEAYQIMTGASSPEKYNIANNEANNN